MKQLITLPGFIFLFSLSLFGQDSLKKTNPIIFGDIGFGIPVSGIDGIQFNSSLNYQYKKSLFTLRIVAVQSFTVAAAELTPITFFPYFKDAGHLTEESILYGWRFAQDGHSYSISAGISDNDRVIVYYTNKIKHQLEYRYAGLPFEMNVLWFKARKQKYHLYYLIPVGKPTAFGHSFGFKLSGNISQHSYMSLGMVFGLGLHKEY